MVMVAGLQAFDAASNRIIDITYNLERHIGSVQINMVNGRFQVDDFGSVRGWIMVNYDSPDVFVNYNYPIIGMDNQGIWWQWPDFPNLAKIPATVHYGVY